MSPYSATALPRSSATRPSSLRPSSVGGPSATRPSGRVVAALRRLLDHLREQQERQRLDAELSMLSDRDLADIGLSRPVTRGAAFGLPCSLHR